MPCQLIYDGYTSTADCRGLIVTYRPMSLDDWDQHQDVVQGLDAQAARSETAKRLAARIVSWDATGRDGAPAETTAENLLMLPVAVWNRLQDLMLGYTKEGINTQEADAKNSEAA